MEELDKHNTIIYIEWIGSKMGLIPKIHKYSSLRRYVNLRYLPKKDKLEIKINKSFFLEFNKEDELVEEDKHYSFYLRFQRKRKFPTKLIINKNYEIAGYI